MTCSGPQSEDAGWADAAPAGRRARTVSLRTSRTRPEERLHGSEPSCPLRPSPSWWPLAAGRWAKPSSDTISPTAGSCRARGHGAGHHPVHGQGVGRRCGPRGGHRFRAARGLPVVRRVPGDIVMQLAGAALAVCSSSSCGRRAGAVRLVLTGRQGFWNGHVFLMEMARRPRALPRDPGTASGSEATSVCIGAIGVVFLPLASLRPVGEPDQGPSMNLGTYLRARPGRC